MPLTDVAPLEASTEIAAPPAAVWALVSDLRHMPRWSPQCAKTFLRGGEMKDVVTRIELATAEGAGWVDAAALRFGYRHAELPAGAIATRVEVRLRPGDVAAAAARRAGRSGEGRALRLRAPGRCDGHDAHGVLPPRPAPLRSCRRPGTASRCR